MRLWSLHPKYLDRQGLLACWRESLLAQKVILGKTRGYKNHPQLIRFQSCQDPVAGIGTYLEYIAGEAERRGYSFNRTKIIASRKISKILVTSGQVLYEWGHLQAKLTRRDPLWLGQFFNIVMPDIHPLFEVAIGSVEPWEKIPITVIVPNERLGPQ
jgi:hypothetical protein